MAVKPTADEVTLLLPARLSRKAVCVGDVFVMRLRDYGYLKGWVVAVDAMSDEFSERDCLLVYAYAPPSTAVPEPVIGNCERVLIAPQIINRLGWRRGYLETIGNAEVCAERLLRRHCFHGPRREPWVGAPRFVDEYQRPLDRAYEPVGWGGLGNHVTLADECVQALRAGRSWPIV